MYSRFEFFRRRGFPVFARLREGAKALSYKCEIYLLWGISIGRPKNLPLMREVSRQNRDGGRDKPTIGRPQAFPLSDGCHAMRDG